MLRNFISAANVSGRGIGRGKKKKRVHTGCAFCILLRMRADWRMKEERKSVYAHTMRIFMLRNFIFATCANERGIGRQRERGRWGDGKGVVEGRPRANGKTNFA